MRMPASHQQMSWPLALRGKWLFCLAVALLAAAATWWPDGLAVLGYERAALAAGQCWRLLTAHLVHLNTAHLLLNLAGLALLCELVWGDLPWRHAAGMLVMSAMTASAMLYWRLPELAWYAGLSGALHGLWAGCALAGLAPQERRPPLPSIPASAWRRLAGKWPLARCTCLAALLILLVKLALEARFGAPVQAAAAIGAPVVTSAHLYGALGGAAYLLVRRLVLR